MRIFDMFCRTALLLLLAAWAGSAPGLAQEQEEQEPAAPLAAVSEEERAAVQNIYQARDPQQRIQLAEEFLSQYPESRFRGRVYLAVAGAYRSLNNLDKAVQYGEKALELEPENSLAMILVADSLAEMARPGQDDFEEKLARAEDYAGRAQELLPIQFAAQLGLPDLLPEEYTAQQNYVAAQPHAILGFIYLRRHEYEEAEKELLQATQMNQLSPNEFDYLRLGVAQMMQEKYEEAGTSFQRCVELGGGVAGFCQQQLEKVQERKQPSPGPAE